jgi:hypothetical protein
MSPEGKQMATLGSVAFMQFNRIGLSARGEASLGIAESGNPLKAARDR